MLYERKALLIWLATMMLFVVTVLAATTFYPMANAVPRSAGVPGGAAVAAADRDRHLASRAVAVRI